MYVEWYANCVTDWLDKVHSARLDGSPLMSVVLGSPSKKCRERGKSGSLVIVAPPGIQNY